MEINELTLRHYVESESSENRVRAQVMRTQTSSASTEIFEALDAGCIGRRG